MLGDPAGWPTSIASVKEDIPPFGDQGERRRSVSSVDPFGEGVVLSPEEEEAIKLEREMNRTLDHMSEEDLAAWELLEREHLKARTREQKLAAFARAAEQSTSTGMNAIAGERNRKDHDVDILHTQKELTQLLLDTLPPLKLVERRPDVDPVIPRELAEMIRAKLPLALKEARTWKLVYSLEQHGISLSTLYRLSSEHYGPVVLGIKSTMGEVFGAFLTETLLPRGGY